MFLWCNVSYLIGGPQQNGAARIAYYGVAGRYQHCTAYGCEIWAGQDRRGEFIPANHACAPCSETRRFVWITLFYGREVQQPRV